MGNQKQWFELKLPCDKPKYIRKPNKFMITYAVTALSALTVVAFIALARALKHAPEGYEDGTGFHHGMTPRPVIATVHSHPHLHDTDCAA